MSHLRPLGETLADLVGGVYGDLPRADAAATLRLASVELTVPLDLDLRADGAFCGDLPLFRRRTAFDPAPARLRLVLGEVAS